jgi:RNA polymerase sigma factor (sigma-70 family)
VVIGRERSRIYRCGGRSGKGVYRSDPKLIEACLRGEQAAWDELVERYGRLVYSIPRRYGLDEADADDVSQSVFSILFRKLDTLVDQTRLSAWLITTTHRECWRIGRQSKRSAAIVDAAISDVSSPSAGQMERWERQELVRRALERLGGRCEALLRELFTTGSDGGYESIAERLGMKVGSIGPTRARCFEKLEKILREMGFDPEQASIND